LCLVIPNGVVDDSYPGGASAFIDELSMRDDIRNVVTDVALTVANLCDPAAGDMLQTNGLIMASSGRTSGRPSSASLPAWR